jgi:hypothetical protein
MKPDPKIYHRAAELIASGYPLGCCSAITNAHDTPSTFSPELDAFEELFKPTADEVRALNREAEGLVAGTLFWWHGPDRQNERVLALLFMEQIARTP